MNSDNTSKPKAVEYQWNITDDEYITISPDDLDDIMKNTITTAGAQGSTIPSGSYTINTSQFNGTSANYYWSNSSITSGTNPSSIDVIGDANFEGDIKWKGRSLGTMLETIEKRLAILQPDPEKLEHFEALRRAYEHYKTLEALCEVPKKETK